MGSKIPGATVTVNQKGREPAATMITGQEGDCFFFSPLVPGLVEIEVRAPGFLPSVRRGIEIRGGIESSAHIPLQLAAVTCDPGPEFSFQKSAGGLAEITGTVVLPGAVYASDIVVTTGGGKGATGARIARTDETGRFRISDLEQGRYGVTVHSASYADFILESVDVRSGQITAIEWELSLERCPLKGACVATSKFAPVLCL